MAEETPRVKDLLTPEERAVYEEVKRARAAIAEAVTALGASRDARARALLRTVEEQAEGLQHVLEWHAHRRAVHEAAVPPSRRPDDDPVE